MTKARSLTIIIVVGFLVSILFSVIFSFADEQLTFTAYYPSPNGYYNQLNATDLSVTNKLFVGKQLNIGSPDPNSDADVNIISPNDPASLVLIGVNDTYSYADLSLAAYEPSATNDPHIWVMTHSAQTPDEHKLIYRHHESGSGPGNFPAVLTMDTNGNVGIGTTSPATPLHVYSDNSQTIEMQGTQPTIFFNETDESNPNAAVRNQFQIRKENRNLHFQAQNDAGTNPEDKVVFHNDGNVTMPNGYLTIGRDTPTGNGLYVYRNAIQETHKSAVGAYIDQRTTTTNNVSYPTQGVKAVVNSYVNAGRKNTGGVIGVNSQAIHRSKGNLQQIYGAMIEYGSILAGGAGTINNAYGVSIRPYKYGPITDRNYALHIWAMPNSGPSEYAIYQEGAADDNYFAGRVGIGSKTPSERLEIDGKIKFTGGGKIGTNAWPEGSYCIMRSGGSCPTGFNKGYICVDTEDDDNLDKQGGSNGASKIHADCGGSSARFEFCCK